MGVSSILRLVRPHQYVKNFFIFLPLFFAAQITDTNLFFNAAIAFIAFSLASSAVYILNDFRDIEDDKLHPIKKTRPLAAGTITVPGALMIMTILFGVGIILMASVSYTAMNILLVYLILNIAYSFYLKHVAVLDVMIVAIGFVLRIFVGSAVTGIPLSTWIVIMTFLLALFMALAKRRDDVLIYLETGEKMRKVVDGYNLQFLDTAIAIMASVVIVAYTIYTASPEVITRVQNEYLYLTAFFVMAGVLRYLQIIFVEKDSGSPTRIVLTDPFMLITLISWIATFSWVLY